MYFSLYNTKKTWRGNIMFSYKPLWKLLIEKGINKGDLSKACGLSSSTIAKMSKGDYVSLEVINRICTYFNCQPGDIFEYIPDKE